MKTLISVIVPVYNVAEFLPRTINSILAQTYKNFELILVDDGSPDNSGQICDKYAAKDNRIRVYHTPNAGAGAARIYGVGKAIGHWIMFIDSDDTIPETTLANLIEFCTKGYDIIIGTINLNNKTIYKHKKSGILNQDEYIEALLLGETSVGPVAKLYKKELFINSITIPKHITNNEDLLMLISIAIKVKRIFISNDIICYNYLYREGSASKSRGMATESWLDLFDIIEKILVEKLDNPKIHNAFINYRLRLLYIVATIKGYIVNSSSKKVRKIINECQEKELSTDELKMLKTIQSISRQKRLYRYNSFISFIRKIVKKILMIN